VNDILPNNFEMKELGVINVIINIKMLREGIGGVTFLPPHCGKGIGSFWV
jgi:hypothetical protein